jgi:hypothetical protein
VGWLAGRGAGMSDAGDVQWAELDTAANNVRMEQLAGELESILKTSLGRRKEGPFEIKREVELKSFRITAMSVKWSRKLEGPADARPPLHFSNVATLSSPALMIPEIGLKLVPFIVPRRLRDAVTGDLAEEFRTYAARWGRPYALRWLWWEIAGMCIRRFGPTAVITAAAAWFRHKFGW